MYKKIIWPLLLVSAVALTLLFASGFVASITVSRSDDSVPADETVEESADLPEESLPAGEASDILILGDSIGFGVGDEENLGIGGRYLTLLDEENEEKSLSNRSVPGHDSTQLADLIDSGELGPDISSAQLIIVSIGGNDLNRLVFEDELTLTPVFEDALNTYLENLRVTLSEIRDLNPEAQLALIGLYNPYGSDEPEQAGFLLEWNYETRVLAHADTRLAYIPTYELFEYHLNEYLAPDDFHPSGAGYQVIAETLFQILN